VRTESATAVRNRALPARQATERSISAPGVLQACADLEPDLAKIVEAWAGLPEAIRAAILARVRVAGPHPAPYCSRGHSDRVQIRRESRRPDGDKKTEKILQTAPWQVPQARTADPAGPDRGSGPTRSGTPAAESLLISATPDGSPAWREGGLKDRSYGSGRPDGSPYVQSHGFWGWGVGSAGDTCRP
jgi:hypothetical protein